MGRKCEFGLCPNRIGNASGKTFHSFPKQPEKCALWVQLCCSEELAEIFSAGGVAAVRLRLICSSHFLPEAYINPLQPEKGLRPNAVPTVGDRYYELMVAASSITSSNEYNATNQQAEITPMIFTSELKDNDVTHMMGERSTDDASSQAKDLGSFPVLAEESNTEECVHVEESQPDDDIGDTSYKQMYTAEKCSRLQTERENQTLKKKLRASDRKSNWRLQANIVKKKKLIALRAELKQERRSNDESKRLGNLVKSNKVLHNSMLNASKKPQGRRYNMETKKFAVGTYLAGPSAYRSIQRSQVLTLPHKMTLGRYNADVRIAPGINYKILNKLEQKTRNFSKREKAVMIAIDGMSIKAELTYNARTDTFMGFPSDGKLKKFEKNNPKILATEAVAIMVCGISTLEPERWAGNKKVGKHQSEHRRFKQAIGYVLAHHTLGSEAQLKIVEQTVKSLKQRGLEPVALVMDQCTTNVKMAKEAGVTEKMPLLHIDGSTLAHFYDNPHLIKNARNNLYKHNAVIDGKIASFEDIRKLYHADNSSVPRLVPKLAERYVYQKPFSSMNVAQATRTLSTSVAKGLEYYVESGEMPSDALGTAVYAEFFDILFDIFNSRSPQATISKPYRTAIRSESFHWDFLSDAEETLRHMYFIPQTCFNIDKAPEEANTLMIRQRRPTFVSGLISNTYALRWLFKHLSENFAFDHLCTNFLTQDPQENNFSDIRRRCGCNDVPTAYQFGAAYKYAAIAANEKLSAGANCEDDDALPFLEDDDFTLDGNDTQCERYTYEFKPLDTVDIETYTPKELNGLMYILGASASKLKHQRCRKQLLLKRDDAVLNSCVTYKFCLLKNAECYPGTTLYEIGILAFTSFRQRFSTYLYQNRKYVKARLSEHVEYDRFEAYVCPSCFKTIVDKLLNTLISSYLKQLKNNTTKRTTTKRVRGNGKRNRKAKRMNLPEK